MLHLRHRELRRFSESLEVLSDASVLVPALSDLLLRAIARLIPVDRVSFNEGCRDTGQVLLAHSLGEPPAPRLVAGLNAHIREHPGFNQPDSDSDWPRPTKISDFLTQRQFRELGLYQDHFRLHGIHYQLGIAFGTGGAARRKISFGLNRARRDFTEEDRSLLTLLRPHLARRYAQAQSHTLLQSAVTLRDRALETAAIVLLDTRGGIIFCSPRARTLLGFYFPAAVRPTDESPDRLPETLAQWIARRCASGQKSDPTAQTWLTLRRPGRKLLVHLVASGRGGDEDARQSMLRLTEHPLEPSAEPLRALGLSEREAEILLWLAQGKRNAEIALICRLRPLTVATHVRNLMEKLRCETRTAAAALAWETLTEAQSGNC